MENPMPLIAVTLLAVRLTCSLAKLLEGEEDSFISYLNEKFDTIIVYEHSDKPMNIHCHLLLCDDDGGITPDAIRKSPAFRRLGLGNRQHSFKSSFKNKQGQKIDMTIDNCRKYITYMTKGKIEIPDYHNSGYHVTYKECCKLSEDWIAPQINRTQQKVLEFERHLGNDTPPISLTTTSYDWLKKKVWDFVMNKYGGFDHKAAADFKMLFVTFLWKRGYSTPEKSKQYI